MKPEEVTTTNLGTLLSELADGLDDRGAWSMRLGVEGRQYNIHSLMACLGSRYRECSLANYELYDEKKHGDLAQHEIYIRVKLFCEKMPERIENGGGLIFYGRSGTGKDHLMTAAMYFAILRYGYNVLWVNGMTLAQRIRDNIGSHSESVSERRLLDRYVEPQILAISDPLPPKGDTSQFITDALQRIVDKRYRRGVSTWCTMNVHNSKEAEQRLASPIIDRLRHNSLTLSCNWESYRAR